MNVCAQVVPTSIMVAFTVISNPSKAAGGGLTVMDRLQCTIYNLQL